MKGVKYAPAFWILPKSSTLQLTLFIGFSNPSHPSVHPLSASSFALTQRKTKKSNKEKSWEAENNTTPVKNRSLHSSKLKYQKLKLHREFRTTALIS